MSQDDEYLAVIELLKLCSTTSEIEELGRKIALEVQRKYSWTLNEQGLQAVRETFGKRRRLLRAQEEFNQEAC